MLFRSITTGIGKDIILGGLGADSIVANSGEVYALLSPTATWDSNNIVIGDHGYIDWTIDDGIASDIDRISTTDPGQGGNDSITTGAGDDIVLGGVGSDTIVAGEGNNLVLGDNGSVRAAVQDAPNFSTQPITLGLVSSSDPTIGGNDSITGGLGKDIIIGGLGNDDVIANSGESYNRFDATSSYPRDNDNIVLGDHGFIDWTIDDADPSDIDQLSTSEIGRAHV